MLKIFLIILALLVLWTIYSFFISRAEQMTYTVLEQRDGYEVRQYDPYIAATVVVKNSGRDGMNSAFRILAGYIFGGNEKSQGIAMTAPVITTENKSETIAMTAPVMAGESGNETTMTFSMPRKYTLATLPKPLDNSIQFSEVPGKKFAVYRFGWSWGEERIKSKKAEFMELLKQAKVETLSEPIYAGYNGPGTIPFMVRNEILVEIK